MRFTARTSVLMSIVLALAVAMPLPSAQASVRVRLNAAEGRILRLVNASRARAGEPPLQIAAGYTDVARRWSASMAARETLVHNPSLSANVRVSGGARWRAIGENVGWGYAADSVFDMYMHSPPHRANILGAGYRFVGIGWVQSRRGPGYTTLVFSSAYSDSYGGTRVRQARCTCW